MQAVPQIESVVNSHPELDVVLLFGSMATGKGRPDSDVDLAVQAAQPLSAGQKMALIADFAEATGRAVDLVDLRTAGEPLLGQILDHGRRIRCSNAAYAELLRRHLFDTEDFMPYVTRMLAERRKAWIG
ncbi:MAG: nucleotidyltransferase domain-containing protein [Burkholderiales bacterium]|nr:nucleotidyltransferase domain-containing protein [Burkholderiales bacterium]